MLGPKFEVAIIQISKEDLEKIQKDYEKHKRATPQGTEVRPIEEVIGAFAVMGFDIAQEAMLKREEYMRRVNEQRRGK